MMDLKLIAALVNAASYVLDGKEAFLAWIGSRYEKTLARGLSYTQVRELAAFHRAIAEATPDEPWRSQALARAAEWQRIADSLRPADEV